MSEAATPSFTLATASDADLITTLTREFYRIEHITVDAARARRAIETLLADRALGAIFLVHADGGVAGYGVVTFGFSLEFHGRYALLDELYLRDAARGRGLGRAALAFVDALCEEEGVASIRLEVARDNARARAVYHRAGYSLHHRDLLIKLYAAS